VVKRVIPNFGGAIHIPPPRRVRSHDRGGMQELRFEPTGSGRGVESLSTPFEDWCAARGIHPETLGAWECFEAADLTGRPGELV